MLSKILKMVSFVKVFFEMAPNYNFLLHFNSPKSVFSRFWGIAFCWVHHISKSVFWDTFCEIMAASRMVDCKSEGHVLRAKTSVRGDVHFCKRAGIK